MQISFQRLGALVIVAAGSVCAHASDILFSAQADEPIATLTREHGMVRGVVDAPLVTVFGSGLVRVNRAPYMKNPGVSEYRLEPDALKALVTRLSPVFGLSTQQLGREMSAAAEARQRSTGEQFVTLDSTITRISIALDAFSRDGSAGAPVNTSLALGDVQEKALRYDNAGLQSLADAEKALLDLMKFTPATEGADNE